jgi:hypothetical protein
LPVLLARHVLEQLADVGYLDLLEEALFHGLGDVQVGLGVRTG